MLRHRHGGIDQQYAETRLIREIDTYTDDQLDRFLDQLRRPGEPLILDLEDRNSLPPKLLSAPGVNASRYLGTYSPCN